MIEWTAEEMGKKGGRISKRVLTHEQSLQMIEIRKKHSARAKLKYAIETNKIIRPRTCQDCGKPCIPDGHHHKGYENALDVVWLCRKCHWTAHPEDRHILTPEERHIIRPEDRHVLTPEERGHRPRVSPGEPSRSYRIQVGLSLWEALRTAGAATVRAWLRALCRFKPKEVPHA